VDARVHARVAHDGSGGVQRNANRRQLVGDSGREREGRRRVAGGNEVLAGIVTCLASGTACATRSGRRLRHSGFSPALTIVEVRAIDAKPSAAALRPSRPPATASTTAAAVHSLERSAARDTAANPRSNLGVGVAEIAA
jgi:hypothetical protein